MNIKNYEEAVELVQPFLSQYLQEQGIDTSKSFCCISPDHPDKTPSASIPVDNPNVFHCFGCGVSGSILHAVHFLEGKPLVGQEFILENLQYLCKKYKVDLEYEPLTEEELYELDTYRAYRTAAELVISGSKTEQFSGAVGERGWTGETCNNFGVGCVSEYKAFRERLRGFGFAASFIDDIDLGRKDIFGEDRLIFTIRDHRGRPVGFASRNLNYTEDKENGAKYVNQRSTGVKCNIYKKSTRLFGLDRALKARTKKNSPIYIFEGYSDVVTATQHGLTNTVALGGTALTADQVHLLKDQGYYDIILCLDGDEPGQKRTAEILDNTLSGHKDLKVRTVIIPQLKDPDQFIRDDGLPEFKKLKKWSAFEWRLNRFDEEAEGEEICRSMIPLIVNETSYITQESMCETLAKASGFTQKAIQAELGRLQNKKEAEKSRDRTHVVDKMMSDLRKDPDQAEYILQSAQGSLFEIARKYEEDSLSHDSCLSLIQTQKSYQEGLDGKFSGFRLGIQLKGLEKALCGNWKQDVWWCIAGKPNCGKTSFVGKLMYEIAKEKDNDACVIYHTIDDTIEQVLPKFVCLAEGSKKMTINQVMDPNYHSKDHPEILDKRETGYSLISELVRAGRLIIKDANDGVSIAYADMLIKYFREKYPKRNIVYVLDNFHKLSDFAGKSDERVRFKELSKVMKNLATKYHITVITTVEYRKIKKGDHGGNDDLAETGQIEYDANIVTHVYNEVHEKGEAAVHCHQHDFGEGLKKCPRIEFNFGKNKVTGFKNKLWFDFFPDSSDFSWIDDKVVAIDAQKQKEVVGDSMLDQKNDYMNWVAEAIEKGWKSTAPNAKYKEKYGDWPPNEWQDQVKESMQ